MLRWFFALFLMFCALGGGALALMHRQDLPTRALTHRYAGAHSEFLPLTDGLTVHVQDQGPATGLPVILLHGSNLSVQVWAPWINRMGTRYRFVSIDLPGHGLTGPHPDSDYRAEAYIDVVHQVARAKRFQRYVIAGHSLGGWIAWRYALAFPTEVDALILVAPAGIVPRKAAPPELPLGYRIASLPLVGKLSAKFTPDWLVEDSLRQSVAIQNAITPQVVRTVSDLLRYPGNRNATMDRLSTDMELHMQARLGQIVQPTLVLWGRLDKLTRVQAGEHIAATLPNASLVIYEGVGHLPQMEVPDESAADVRRFLDGVQRRKLPAQELTDQLDLGGPEELPNWP
jgi:pimeloyl-ACP methyl ester carboxylesterase